MMNLRYPNIPDGPEKVQIQKLISYLHQLVDQLNWALSILEKNNTEKK